MNSSRTISPRKSWKDLENHYIHLFEDPWYKILAEVQNLISIYTMEFYKNKNIKTLYLPVTTGSISSPMGLGSDSSPVKVELCEWKLTWQIQCNLCLNMDVVCLKKVAIT